MNTIKHHMYITPGEVQFVSTDAWCPGLRSLAEGYSAIIVGRREYARAEGYMISLQALGALLRALEK